MTQAQVARILPARRIAPSPPVVHLPHQIPTTMVDQLLEMPTTTTTRSTQAPTMHSRAVEPIRPSNNSNNLTTPTITNGVVTALGAVVEGPAPAVLATIMVSGADMVTTTETGVFSLIRVPFIRTALGGGAGVSFVKV